MHLAKGLDHVREKERGEERRRTNKKVEEKRLSKRWIRRRKKKVKLQDAKKAKRFVLQCTIVCPQNEEWQNNKTKRCLLHPSPTANKVAPHFSDKEHNHMTRIS